MPCVELVTHLWFRYSFSSEAPSSSQVQDTRFSSLEQGFESPWGHVQRHAAMSIAACVVLFGMDALCEVAGIYSSEGQRYTPKDAGAINNYREGTDGQILQEGICESGAIGSFFAAGTNYATFGVPTIPFYLFYSIFGFQ